MIYEITGTRGYINIIMSAAILSSFASPYVPTISNDGDRKFACPFGLVRFGKYEQNLYLTLANKLAEMTMTINYKEFAIHYLESISSANCEDQYTREQIKVKNIVNLELKEAIEVRDAAYARMSRCHTIIWNVKEELYINIDNGNYAFLKPDELRTVKCFLNMPTNCII